MMRIGEVVAKLGVSADTLRYYEKIDLMRGVGRRSGVRCYREKDLARIRFIRRAQKMGFTLDDIRQLLGLREDPQNGIPKVREMALHKLAEIETHLDELVLLRNELKSMTSLCGAGRSTGCVILEKIESGTQKPCDSNKFDEHGGCDDAHATRQGAD